MTDLDPRLEACVAALKDPIPIGSFDGGRTQESTFIMTVAAREAIARRVVDTWLKQPMSDGMRSVYCGEDAAVDYETMCAQARKEIATSPEPPKYVFGYGDRTHG